MDYLSEGVLWSHLKFAKLRRLAKFDFKAHNCDEYNMLKKRFRANRRMSERFQFKTVKEGLWPGFATWYMQDENTSSNRKVLPASSYGPSFPSDKYAKRRFRANRRMSQRFQFETVKEGLWPGFARDMQDENTSSKRKMMPASSSLLLLFRWWNTQKQTSASRNKMKAAF